MTAWVRQARELPAKGPCLFDRLQVPDEVLQRVQALLHREGELVVDSAQELGHAPRRDQVRRPAQADAERVQLVLPVVRVLRLLQVPAGLMAKTVSSDEAVNAGIAQLCRISCNTGS